MSEAVTIPQTAADALSERKRRNVLIVSSSVAAAALMGLKIPSLTAEFARVDSVAITPGRAWIVAAILVFYLLARYHFSDARRKLWEELWKDHIRRVGDLIDPAISASFDAQRMRKVELLAQQNSTLEFKEATNWKRRRRWYGTDFDWWARSRKKSEDGIWDWGDHSHEWTTIRMPWRSVGSHAFCFPFTVLWSRVAWEMNVVYAIAIAAIGMSIYRAYTATPELPWCLVVF